MTDHATAQKVCTPNEHAAYKLASQGMSQRNIALELGISRSAVRARLEEARRKIEAAEKEQAA